MNCAACGTENSATAKFCRGCGASLSAAAAPPSAAAPSPEPGKAPSGRSGIAWAVGAIVLLAIAGGGGYAWYQHVEETRIAEEKRVADEKRVAEEKAAAEAATRASKAAATKRAAEAAHAKTDAEAAPARRAAAPVPASNPGAGAQRLRQELAAACGSIPDGLKKTWCEERTRERYCSGKSRTSECP